jgi:hypothetical protein
LASELDCGSGTRAGAAPVWYCHVARSYARVVALNPEKKPSLSSVSLKPALMSVAAFVKLRTYSSKYFLLLRM